MRRIEFGINWVFYHTDTREDAREWFKELKGKDLPEWMLFETPNSICFRLHR